ncbi:hypothetical protein [Kutzneria buriramensis]|uniref:Uncharacterized protein n=1 Tax=Kutzneria buriramensis TaxID=1045776 RepID=A0A3E0HEM2_9PSEU|nr:hypothetical protein [Kutzneria buriramensis]REH43721.1 hypothetical protein BCF44_109264 [Kutzneria buriramensis]
MFSERVVERYRFTCARCGEHSDDVFQVTHVTDAEGDLFSYYSHGGFPCEAPVAAENLCSGCHCGPVHVEMLSSAPWRPAEGIVPGG